MQPELRIRLLGDFRVAQGEAPVTSLNTPRLQAFLAYLLLHRDAPQSRRHIAFLFWPDSSETQAQSNLRNLIVALRRALPNSERYVAVHRQTLQWHGDYPFTFDVSDFERALVSTNNPLDAHLGSNTYSSEQIRSLRTAVDLYTGDLLPGCYDEWIAAPRERLRQGFLEALQQLVRALEQANDLTSAILYARRLLRHDPLHEEIYRQLMRLYVANSDGAAAITIYRHCESVLKRELGVEPGPATREIARQVEEVLRSEEGEAGKVRGHRRKLSGKGSRPDDGLEAVPGTGNLPASTTLFIGREREISLVSDMLKAPNVRLVTITGTPGTGKTRLALQVAFGLAAAKPGSRSSDAYAHPFLHGTYFVPLASVGETQLVASTIASALGLVEAGNRPAIDALLQHLRDKSVLLVLDNFEHLLPAASVVAELLSACPRLKVLVTSRSPLNLRGEREYALPPMSVPGRDALLQPDELVQYEAVALFVERALEVSPGFALTRDNARPIGEICRRLEGLPLAIELAAARVKVLSPEAILSRLDRKLKLLVGGKSDLPHRQRTLEAAIAWSYNLLDQTEKALFRRLAVFSGGWTLEAAAAVVGNQQPAVDSALDTTTEYQQPATDDILDSLSALVNKSLLSRLDTGTAEKPTRFFMLETIREYALEKLRESGDEEISEEVDCLKAHARYFMALAEEAEPHLVGPEQVEWMDRLEDERDNFRAALRWARKAGMGNGEVAQQASETGLRIVGALWLLWKVRGDNIEARQYIEQALAIARMITRPTANNHVQMTDYEGKRGEESFTFKSSRAYLAKGLYGAAIVAYRLDDFRAARTLYEESLAIRREIEDKHGIGESLHSLGTVIKAQGEYAFARLLYEQALDIRREIGDKRGIADTLQSQGYLAYIHGDYALARSLLEQSVATGREVGDKVIIAWALYHLGLVALAQADYGNARALFEQYLEIGREIGHRGGVAQAIGNLGSMASSQGDYASARSLYQQSLAGRREIDDKYGVAVCLVGLAEVEVKVASFAERQGLEGNGEGKVRSKNAARLLGAAEVLVEALGAPLAGDERFVYERGVAAAREMLGETAFRDAMAEGRAMTLEQAMALAESL